MGLFPKDDPNYAAVYAEEAAMIEASELIAEALERQQISRAELARRLGISRSEITDRLRGNRNITVRALAATLHALGGRLSLEVELPEPSRVTEPIELAAYRRWSQAPVSPTRSSTAQSRRAYQQHMAAGR